MVPVHHRHLGAERGVGWQVKDGGSDVMSQVGCVRVNHDGNLYLVPATFTGLPVL